MSNKWYNKNKESLTLTSQEKEKRFKEMLGVDKEDTLKNAIKKGYEYQSETITTREDIISKIEFEVNQWLVRQTQKEMTKCSP